MTHTLARWTAALALAGAALAPAHAVQLTSQFTALGGQDWQFDFTLTNDDQAAGVSEFTVWFDRAVFTGLSVQASPAGWDSLVAQPDPSLPAHGFFDSLALATPLALGATQGGFQVKVSTAGLAAPTGALVFDIVDPASGATLAGGMSLPSAVPEPSAAALALAGLAFLGGLAARRARQAAPQNDRADLADGDPS